MKVISRLQFSILAIFALCGSCLLFSSATAQSGNRVKIALPPAVTPTPSSLLGKHTVTPQGQLEVYDHGDPTNEEQYELELINRARANPSAEGDLLFNTNDPYVDNQYTQWGTPTRSQVRADFKTYAAKPPLAFNAALIAAARRHSQDMLDHNYQEHNSPIDNSTPFTRMTDAGYVGYDFAGENIFAYGNDDDEINQEFEIDFGNPGLGHRENLINFGNYVYSEIGLGMIHGNGSGGINPNGPDAGPIVTTEDFGHINGNVFITGVVYGDDNKNNFYDIGEGLAGVTIEVSGGSTTAISSGSGGYAIPYTDQGSVTVTASGGPLTTPISHNVSLNGENVKVDFVQGKTGFPDKPILISPKDTVINTDTAHFRWTKATGETKYWIVVATDSKMTKVVLKDTTLTANARTFPKPSGTEKPLVDGTFYYWQVKSKNVIGWGQFSPIDSFAVALPPKPIVQITPADKANTGTADVVFTWHRSNPDANDYVLQVATDNTFKNVVSNDTLNFGVTVDDTAFTIAGKDLQAQTTYYWRVFADNDNGWNTQATIRSFTTGGVSSVASSSNDFAHMTISPNPSSGETHIRFLLDKSEDVSLKVFDVTGAEESMTVLGRLDPNRYDIIWNVGRKPAGVYPFELRVGNRLEAGRIVVVK